MFNYTRSRLDRVDFGYLRELYLNMKIETTEKIFKPLLDNLKYCPDLSVLHTKPTRSRQVFAPQSGKQRIVVCQIANGHNVKPNRLGWTWNAVG